MCASRSAGACYPFASDCVLSAEDPPLAVAAAARVKMRRMVPMLPVSSMPASVNFYQKLGFSVEQRNDAWRWAMLCFGDCRLMVDESINVDPTASRAFVLYLYPNDVIEYHEQVRSNGVAVPDLQVTFYGMTEFRIDDPDGNRLWIGQEAAREIPSAG
jgi:uncharacterized glyoxalase superfamily protein PhnB